MEILYNVSVVVNLVETEDSVVFNSEETKESASGSLRFLAINPLTVRRYVTYYSRE